MKTHAKKLVLASLFAALSLAATLFFAVPLPTGYANLGDCLAFASGFLLGGTWGAAAAGVGIALADLLGGFGIYAVATFVIKAFIALCGTAAAKVARGRSSPVLFAAFSLIGEAVMVLGYFFFESVFLGVGDAAIASVPGNLSQAAVGTVTSVVLTVIFTKNKKLGGYIKR